MKRIKLGINVLTKWNTIYYNDILFNNNNNTHLTVQQFPVTRLLYLVCFCSAPYSIAFFHEQLGEGMCGIFGGTAN